MLAAEASAETAGWVLRGGQVRHESAGSTRRCL